MESHSNDRADRGQQPLSFLRQLLAGCLCPALLDGGTLAPDAIEQARAVLKRCPEGMGAYSSSKGLALVREAVAAFLEKRDDQPADPEHIFLTAGASEGIKTVLSMVIRDQSDGESCCSS